MKKLLNRIIKKLPVTDYLLPVTASEASTGFSLIELVVVVAILGGLSIAISRSFFSQIKGSEKTQALAELRQAGDRAMLIMKNKIRNAREIKDGATVCDGRSLTALEIESRDASEKSYASAKSTAAKFTCGSRIMLNEGKSGNTPITPDITEMEVLNCSFACVKSAGTPAKVKIQFNLQQKGTSESLTFSSNVSLRNY